MRKEKRWNQWAKWPSEDVRKRNRETPKTRRKEMIRIWAEIDDFKNINNGKDHKKIKYNFLKRLLIKFTNCENGQENNGKHPSAATQMKMRIYRQIQ